MYEQGNFSAVEMGELGNLEYSSGAYFQMTNIGCIKQIEVLSSKDFSLKFRGIALQEYFDLENGNGVLVFWRKKTEVWNNCSDTAIVL